MSSDRVAEARERLPDLVERVLRGEPVATMRDGRPVAELRPVERGGQAGPVTREALAWLDRLRVMPARTPSLDAAALLRPLRDEGP